MTASRIRCAGAFVVLGVAALLLILLVPSSDRQAVLDDRASVEREVVAALPPGTGALIERLRRTNLLNADEIHDRLGLESASPTHGFLTKNPYEPPYRESCPALADLRYPLPPHPQSYEWDEAAGTFSFRGQEPVLEWYSSLASDTEVCAPSGSPIPRAWTTGSAPSPTRRARSRRVTSSPTAATAAPVRRCGISRSTWRDRISPRPRGHAREGLTAGGVKRCLMEELGLSERCAETWTFNVLHTRRRCAGACIGHYGLWNVLTNHMDGVRTDEGGNLNPCLACDEHASGPGFRFAAGRTRRSSGLVSAIPRTAGEMYAVDHWRYFR